jgi:peptide/nickel transport system permease protein
MATSARESHAVPSLEADAWAAEWASLELAVPGEDHAVIERKVNYVAIMGFVALAIVLAMAVFGPMLVSFEPDRPDPSVTLTGPSRDHPMGTDQYGRDVLSRVVHAARLDLRIAFSITLLALSLGSVIGGIIGFYGGAFEDVVMRVVDVLLAFPGFVLALGITAMLGNSTRNVIIAVAVAYLPYYIRLVRSEMLSLRELEYASAAKVVGVRRIRILLYHLLPNALPIALAQATLTLGWGILDAAGLSFLGVGIRPPTAEWGVLVGEGAQYINSGQWWISVFPGLAILIAVLGFNLVGDWLRDRFGPR